MKKSLSVLFVGETNIVHMIEHKGLDAALEQLGGGGEADGTRADDHDGQPRQHGGGRDGRLGQEGHGVRSD